MKLFSHTSFINILTKNKFGYNLFVKYSALTKSLYKYIPGKVITYNIDNLICRPFGYNTFIPVKFTPSYLSFFNNNYIKHFKTLNINNRFISYYLSKFEKLKFTQYLNNNNTNNYILVYKDNNDMKIVDGIHRASILRYNGTKYIRVKQINYFWFKVVTLLYGW